MLLLAHWLLNCKCGSVKLLFELLCMYFVVPEHHEGNG